MPIPDVAAPVIGRRLAPARRLIRVTVAKLAVRAALQAGELIAALLISLKERFLQLKYKVFVTIGY